MRKIVLTPDQSLVYRETQCCKKAIGKADTRKPCGCCEDPDRASEVPVEDVARLYLTSTEQTRLRSGHLEAELHYQYVP